MISIRREMPEITTSIVEQSFSAAKFAERNQEDLDEANKTQIPSRILFAGSLMLRFKSWKC